ncbi:hypothetical protein EMPS_06743 [Entomortierella parvispora]|uniref:Uncharacterized protein n=1 Tax=Entomortierella parvispora TaxID=205924 RepID=A0A9P3HCV8_9FUNG|nr:hypothetical protein EMPS_06743 [Entomortierella parvispora]
MLIDSSSLSIGIHLGDTGAYFSYCSDCRIKNSMVTAATPCHNATTMPCYVYYSDSTHLIEEASKLRNYIHPFMDAKRQIGLIFDKDKDSQFPPGQCWPFDVVDKDSLPYIQETRKAVDNDLASGMLSPQAISYLVYEQAKMDAEILLGPLFVVGSVIFPHHWNIEQEMDIMDKEGGGMYFPFSVSEPEAAAIAYRLEMPPNKNRYAIVFHLSGNALTITHLLIMSESRFDVLGMVSDRHFGGDTFTDRLVEHSAKEFERMYNKDLRNDSNAVRKLWSACEKAKVVLSSAHQASIEVASLFEGMDFSLSISRSVFEDLNQDVFSHIRRKLDSLLKSSNGKNVSDQWGYIDVGKADIAHFNDDESKPTWILGRIRLSQRSCGKYHTFWSPQEVTAFGAAMVAFQYIKSDPPGICCFPERSLARSIGLEITEGVMTPVLWRNADLPASQVILLTTVADNQTSVLLRIFEGERLRTKDNLLLGEVILTLHRTPLAPRGALEIQVTFAVSRDHHLLVMAPLISSYPSSSLSVALKEVDRLMEKNSDQEHELNERQLEMDKEYVALAQANAHQRIFDSTSQQVMVHPNQVNYCAASIHSCYVIP